MKTECSLAVCTHPDGNSFAGIETASVGGNVDEAIGVDQSIDQAGFTKCGGVVEGSVGVGEGYGYIVLSTGYGGDVGSYSAEDFLDGDALRFKRDEGVRVAWDAGVTAVGPRKGMSWRQ